MSKTIVITGANKGIGKAAAELLIQDGHRLVLGSRNTDQIAYLQVEHPDQVLVKQADVTDRAQLEALVKEGHALFNSIDVLVNNAGRGGFDFFKDADPDEWDAMIDVNIKGVLYAIHAVLPFMLEKGNGHIINLASVAGHHVFPRSVVYCATKHAVRAISEGLRLEFREEIRTTTISPGAVATNFAEEIGNPDIKAEFEEMLAGGLSPQLIAEAIKQAIDYPEDVTMTEMIIRPRKRS